METDYTLFRSIVESTSDMMLVLDERAHIRYAGRASLPSTGYLPAELEAQAFPTFIHPSDAERVNAALRAARTAPDPLALIECRFRRKDGSWRVLELRVDGLRGLSMAQHVLVICRDVTARSRAARQLRFAQSLQRSQNAATQDALLVLSAEGDVLQCNPRFLQLWGIDSSTVLLRCDADVWRRVLVEIEEPKVFLQMLATIGSDPARVHTSNLRTRAGAVIECYSAPIEPSAPAEDGRLWRFRVVPPQRCAQGLDIGTLVRESLALLRAAAEPGADVRISIEKETPRVQADALAVQRALLHLVLNAARAVNRPKGVIEIGVVATEDRKRGQSIVRLTVADNGVGMSIEETGRLFERPSRAGLALVSGAGLAAVRDIVEGQGGYVSVESRPGAGCTVRIDFPLHTEYAECCGGTRA
jgi:PAS domain S-box-containing protein